MQVNVAMISTEEAKLEEKAAAAKAKEEEQAKIDAAKQEGDNNQQKGRGGASKKKGKEIITSLQLGRGSRALYDYVSVSPNAIQHIAFNAELSLVLTEIL